MGGEGKPIVVYALSTANTTAVGKIVLNNGMVVSNTASLSTAMKEMAIAVIFYKGTGLNNSGYSQRILGIGLNKTKGPLFKDGADGIGTTLGTAVSKSVIDGNITFTGTLDGSGNSNIIKNAVSDWSNRQTYYPALYYAENYKTVEGSHVSGTDYENGWYIPSIAELYQLYNNVRISTTI